MNWQELKNMIKEFTEEQLMQTVTVYIRSDDEFHGLNWDDMHISDESYDVLDPGHKYLVI